MSRILLVLGLALVAIGLLWRWLGRLGIGRLPGDIVIKHENYLFSDHHWAADQRCPNVDFLARQPVIIGGRGRPQWRPQTLMIDKQT